MFSASTLLHRPTRKSACDLIINNDGEEQALAISISRILWRDDVSFKILSWLDELISSPSQVGLENGLSWIKKNSADSFEADDLQAIMLLRENIQKRLSVAYSIGLPPELRRMIVNLIDTITGFEPGLIDESYISHAIYVASQDALFASVPNLINAAKSSNSYEMALAQGIYCNASGSHDQAIIEFERYFHECSEASDPPEWAYIKYTDSCLRVGRDREYIETYCKKFSTYNPSVVLSIANRLKGKHAGDPDIALSKEIDNIQQAIAYYEEENYIHDQPERCAALTIVSRNYLALALTLANSFLDTHPGSLFFIAIVDSHEGIDGLINREGLYAIPYESISIPDSLVFKYRYSILELNTAVKPYALSFIFDGYPQVEKLLYIDPDIKVYSCLRDIWDALDAGNICLTPHLLSPIEDNKSPSEINILQSGSYNLGFIGIKRSNDGAKLLEWWKKRLFLDCRVDIPRGLFTDQKWIDLVPGYFESCKIIRKHEYNIAYWNLHERSCSFDSARRAYINNHPLRFFHFSGYSPAKPNIISKHQDRHQLNNRKDLQPLFNDYAKSLIASGHIHLATIPYEFDYLPCGIKNSRAIRWVLDAASRCDQTVVPDLSDRRQVLEFLSKINTRITNGVILSPILMGIVQTRKDVGNYFSFFDGSVGDLNGLVNWCTTAGCAEEDLQTLIDGLKDENIQLNRIKTSDVQKIVDAWECRADLQENLGKFWKSNDSIQCLKGWLKGSGQSELGIYWHSYISIFNAFGYGAEKLLHAYFIRSDLQEAFPRIYDCLTLQSLSNWMHSNLRDIPNVTHDDVDAFRFIYAKQVDILPVALRNSQWIRNFIPEPSKNVNKAILDAIGVESNRYEDALSTIGDKPGMAFGDAVSGLELVPLKINIAGNFSASTGIGQSVRTLCKSLEKMGRPVSRALWNLPSLFPYEATFDSSSLVSNTCHEYADISIAVCNADSTLYLKQQIPKGFWNASRKVGYWVWETEQLPETMLEGHDIYDEIWTPSEYSASAIRAVTSKPVYVVPHSLPTETFIEGNLEKINRRIEDWCTGKSLKLGYFYDSKSYSDRKNPDAFLALVEALQAENIYVKPIIKVSSPALGDYNYERFVYRAHRCGSKLIFDVLTDIEIYNLYLELDFYVSLHRSEGFGLTCAEALSLGVMTVATGYSGNLMFMTSHNSILVPGDAYKLSTDAGPYPSGTKWVNPNVGYAKEAIVKVTKDVASAKNLMRNARSSSCKQLSSISIGRVLDDLLNAKYNSTHGNL